MMLLGTYFEGRYPMKDLSLDDEIKILKWVLENKVDLTFSYPHIYFKKLEDLTAFKLTFKL